VGDSFWTDDRPPVEKIDARARLVEWMMKHQITGKMLAESVNCSPSMISRFLNGRRGLGFTLAQRIESYTRGSISAHHLCTAEDHLKSSQKYRRLDKEKRTVFEQRDEDMI